MSMAEPELFPNQPNVQDHVNKHKGDPSKNKSSDMMVAGSELNNVATRLKILEERYSTLRNKSQITEQNIIEVEKNHYDDLRIINDDMSSLKHRLREITEKISLLSDEVSQFAHRNDLKVVQKYVEYWQPVDFVTRKEVNDFLRKKFHEPTQKNSSKKESSKEEKK
jgi:predicted nucleic acid-binding protein